MSEALSKQEAMILGLKQDMEDLLKCSKISSYEFGVLRGISKTMFALDLITEEEYKNYYDAGYGKWEINVKG